MIKKWSYRHGSLSRRIRWLFPSLIQNRRRRLYLTFDIAQLLASKGIDSDQLMPRHHNPDNMPTIEEKKDPVFPIYLPLKVRERVWHL